MPIVGVMGASVLNPALAEQSSQLGRWLAAQKVHLLTGGGPGVMEHVSQAFAAPASRQGLVIGIIPGRFEEQRNRYAPIAGYPHRFVEMPIYTHLPDRGGLGLESSSRNHINILTSDIVVLLSGRDGTLCEAQLAVRYAKPAVAWIKAEDKARYPKQLNFADTFEQLQHFIMEAVKRFYG